MNYFMQELQANMPTAIGRFRYWVAERVSLQHFEEYMMANNCNFWLQAGLLQGFLADELPNHGIRHPYSWSGYADATKGQIKLEMARLEKKLTEAESPKTHTTLELFKNL